MAIAKAKVAQALGSSAADHIIAVAADVYDEAKQKYQSEINENVESRVSELEKGGGGESFSGSASDVTFNPAGTGLASANVQEAIAEVKNAVDNAVIEGGGTVIVNDLTTGGADKALSAEMGVRLRSDIEAGLLGSFGHLDGNFEWVKTTQYSTIAGFYYIDGTLRDASFITIKQDVNYGDLIKVELEYSNYSPSIAVVSMWNDDKLVYVNLSTDLYKDFSGTFIVPIPLGVNNVRILQPSNVYLVTGNILQELDTLSKNNAGKISAIENDINSLEIINPNLAYMGEKYPYLGVDNLGKIGQYAWELAVIPVQPNTEYYISCKSFSSISVGALGYSSDKTVKVGQELQYVDMSTLPRYDGTYRKFTTDEYTRYLYINLSPLNKSNKVYITEDPKAENYPTTIGERNILELVNKKSQENFSAKKMAVFGDSITWLALSGNPNRGWATYFKEFMGFGEFVNYARSGATWSNTENTTYNIEEITGALGDNNVIYNQFNRLINDINNGSAIPDYIMICAGTNDQWYPSQRPNATAKTAKEIFEDTSTDYLTTKSINECTSIAESIRYVSEMIFNNCPNAQVVICTPLQGTHGAISNNIAINDIIRDCGNYLGWNVIEQFKECGVSRLQESRGYVNTYDGVHTSEIGAKKVAGILASKCKAILNTMV